MKRYRWVAVEWPFSMRVLAKRLKAKAFEGELADGFVIDRVRDDFVEARFVERVEYDDKVTDPFGSELVFHRVEFRQCRFRAATAGPGLELQDAPRSIQTMVSRLLEVTDFSLAIQPVSIDVLAWAMAVQKRLGKPGIVDSIQIGELDLTKDVTAKVVIKGSRDVLDASMALVNGRTHIVEKVQVSLEDAKRTKLILSTAGVLKLNGEASEEVLDSARFGLLKLLSVGKNQPDKPR